MMNNSTTIEEVSHIIYPISLHSHLYLSLPRLPKLTHAIPPSPSSSFPRPSFSPQIRRSAAQNVTPRPPSPFAILLFWRARLPTPPPTSNDPSSNDNPSNPFRFKHWYTNFGRMLCRPAVPSWMEFDKEVERRGDGREEEGMGMRERRQTGGEEKWRN